MLESIATARSECTSKQENKASYNTYYIVPDSIDFFADDWKEIKTQTEKRKIHDSFLVVSENFLKTIRRNNVLAICISYTKNHC